MKLGGPQDIPAPPARTEEPYRQPPDPTGTADQVAAGRLLFYTWCAKCHSLGVPAVTPDLTRLNRGIADPNVFKTIVLKGALVPLGMPRFDDVMSATDVAALHAFLVDESWTRYRAQAAAAPGPATH
jgi:quinohemoprotein ethanol dehydrogenase